MAILSMQIKKVECTIGLELTEIDYDGTRATCKFRAFVFSGGRLKGRPLKRVPLQKEVLEQLEGRLKVTCFEMLLDGRPAFSHLRKIESSSFGRGGRFTVVIVSLP